MLGAAFGLLGYFLSERYRRVRGVTPWRMPSGVWAALMFLFSLIGVVVYLIACLTTRTRTGPTGWAGGAQHWEPGPREFRGPPPEGWNAPVPGQWTTARLKDGTRRRRATAGRHRPGVGRLLLRRGPRSRDSWHRQCQALPRIRHCPCPHRRLRGLGSRIPPGVMSCVTGTGPGSQSTWPTPGRSASTRSDAGHCERARSLWHAERRWERPDFACIVCRHLLGQGRPGRQPKARLPNG